MSLQLTRAVPARPLPPEWSEGRRFPPVERIVARLSNAWSVSPGAARVLARIVVEERRTRILEFGAGVSSEIFAMALEEIGGGRLTSVEEQPEWCEESWARVESSPKVDSALIHASIRLNVDRRGVYYGYDQREQIVNRGPYDLVFVDAPWRGFGRDGGLHAAIESIAPEGLIVLDDARRMGEQGTVRRWLLNYQDLRLVANDVSVGRGLAVLRKSQGPARRASMLDKVIEIWGSGIYEALRTVRMIRRHRASQEEIRHAG